MPENRINKIVNINLDSITLEGELSVPQKARGLVLFAHGSGSSRFSPRNNYVAKVLQENNLATFLVDLLTSKEDLEYENRFDINLLAERLIQVTENLRRQKEVQGLKIGYFGASTGAASAIKAAVAERSDISAIVSRGGRVDLAYDELPELRVPTLLIVGEKDDFVLALNKDALKRIKFTKKISIIPGATHLFEEPGTLEEVAKQAADWFLTYLKER